MPNFVSSNVAEMMKVIEIGVLEAAFKLFCVAHYSAVFMKLDVDDEDVDA